MRIGGKTSFGIEIAASKVKVSNVSCILPSPDHVPWYQWWVHDQVQRQPQKLFSTLPGHDPKSNERWTTPFVILWQEISRYTTANEIVSIDGIIAHLVQCSILQSASDSEALFTTKTLVFAVIGWQTMLYGLDMHSCPLSQFAIDNEMGDHQGHAYMSLKQVHSVSKKHMHRFLLGFGMLLPPRNFNAPETDEDKAAFNELTTAAPASFNAHFLASIGGIKIEWVDSLACHLEFDRSSTTLFLFRYPSFCVANLPSSESTPSRRSTIYACAAPDASTAPWAIVDDVTQMLHETILSYRLLFGQNKAARQLFRKLEPFQSIHEKGRDEFLTMLCGRKHYPKLSVVHERENYDLTRDFPILRSKLAILLRHISNTKPRGWKELWYDKRDSASWLTFWAVLIIGGLGTILALLQVILQAVSIAQNAGL